MGSDAGQIILVEGMEDLHTIAGFFRNLDLTERIGGDKQSLSLRWKENHSRLDIYSAGGVEKASDFERTLQDIDILDDCRTLALVVDADDSHIDRWRSIHTLLTNKGYTPPGEPSPDGTIIDSESLRPARIGVWIMPDNQRSGMLETFLGSCVPNADTNPVWKTAVSETGALKNDVSEALRFKNSHIDKARIHTYLAWSNPPGLPFGQAILKEILDPASEQAQVFLQWIRDVFDFPGAREDKAVSSESSL